MPKIINRMNGLSIFASHHNHPRASFSPSTFRHSTFGLLFIFSLLTIQSCGLDIEDPTPPSPPQWVEKSLPEEWPERGIDAHESGGIFLEWEPNPKEDIIAYNIYRAVRYAVNDSLGGYTLLARMDRESVLDPKYIDTEVQTRTRYYYKLKAENTSNVLGEFSDSIFYLILPQLSREWMNPNGVTDILPSQRTLCWEYGFYNELEDFCLTILTEANELVSRRLLQPHNYIDEGECWIIPSDIVMNTNEVYRWRIDACAHYQDGRENSGSESHWATFLYTEL